MGGRFGDVAQKTNECLYHIIIMHILNAISKRIKPSSRDIVMEDTHMKENVIPVSYTHLTLPTKRIV